MAGLDPAIRAGRCPYASGVRLQLDERPRHPVPDALHLHHPEHPPDDQGEAFDRSVGGGVITAALWTNHATRTFG